MKEYSVPAVSIWSAGTMWDVRGAGEGPNDCVGTANFVAAHEVEVGVHASGPVDSMMEPSSLAVAIRSMAIPASGIATGSWEPPHRT